jgi:hypothetical protein
MKDKMPIEVLRLVLDADFETGQLFWKHRPRSLFKTDGECKRWNNRYAGQIAMRLKPNGYIEGMIFRVAHKAHRVIWALAHGEWPANDIDHLNGNRVDNRLCNLVVKSRAENSRNAKKRNNNTSGITGVVGSKYGTWRAYICFNYKQIYLGSFATIEEAAAARLAANRKFGFTERHGQ